MIRVVQSNGQNQGMVISLKIESTAQIRTAPITKLNIPKVIILKGKVITFKTGLTKKFKTPSIKPNSTIMCHF